MNEINPKNRPEEEDDFNQEEVDQKAFASYDANTVREDLDILYGPSLIHLQSAL